MEDLSLSRGSYESTTGVVDDFADDPQFLTSLCRNFLLYYECHGDEDKLRENARRHYRLISRNTKCSRNQLSERLMKLPERLELQVDSQNRSMNDFQAILRITCIDRTRESGFDVYKGPFRFTKKEASEVACRCVLAQINYIYEIVNKHGLANHIILAENERRISCYKEEEERCNRNTTSPSLTSMVSPSENFANSQRIRVGRNLPPHASADDDERRNLPPRASPDFDERRKLPPILSADDDERRNLPSHASADFDERRKLPPIPSADFDGIMERIVQGLVPESPALFLPSISQPKTKTPSTFPSYPASSVQNPPQPQPPPSFPSYPTASSSSHFPQGPPPESLVYDPFSRYQYPYLPSGLDLATSNLSTALASSPSNSSVYTGTTLPFPPGTDFPPPLVGGAGDLRFMRPGGGRTHSPPAGYRQPGQMFDPKALLKAIHRWKGWNNRQKLHELLQLMERPSANEVQFEWKVTMTKTSTTFTDGITETAEMYTASLQVPRLDENVESKKLKSEKEAKEEAAGILVENVLTKFGYNQFQ